ncbi:MBL fold metallo-hydrolase [Modestobacter sp. NPDC049651]|uniref:MBL fold metallo-hydrolase n=1 Tax=unclassified Modestobacter TaxID=2643866 RepID=UPI0033E03D78
MRIGDIDVHPVADGTFRASPQYFGEHVTAQGHEDLFDDDGQAYFPIGCFLVRTGDRTVLVDTGLGPAVRDDGPRRLLVGGQLPVGLRAAGVDPADVTDVVCTHLHADHCGGLFDRDGVAVFGDATIWFGAGDWAHFVADPGSSMADRVRHGFLGADAGRLRPVEAGTTIAPGIDLLPTPGHTPGHHSVVVSSGRRRALLLGDAVICPVQLDEPEWSALGDVDPELAARTRERLFRELEGEEVVGAGAHFPELRFGRVLAGEARRWLAT